MRLLLLREDNWREVEAMAYETIVFEQGPVARITLNRPDRLNSFTAVMH